MQSVYKVAICHIQTTAKIFKHCNRNSIRDLPQQNAAQDIRPRRQAQANIRWTTVRGIMRQAEERINMPGKGWSRLTAACCDNKCRSERAQLGGVIIFWCALPFREFCCQKYTVGSLVPCLKRLMLKKAGGKANQAGLRCGRRIDFPEIGNRAFGTIVEIVATKTTSTVRQF